MATHANKKQKFSHQKQSYNSSSHKKKQYLEVGHHGFLATCNFREKDCVRESYNILNEYADELYGPVLIKGAITENTSNTDELDITDELQKQIDATKQSNEKGKTASVKRFQAVDTGANNCIFIRTTLDDPVELGMKIISDIERTRQQKSRFVLRLVPIETVCRANLADITTAGGLLFDKYFIKKPASFSIVFNKRYNNDMKRDDVIRELAALVHSKNAGNRVDLKLAEKTVVVEVIKGLCLMSVVDCYLQYKKFNLIELANVKDDVTEESKLAVQNDEEKVTDENDCEDPIISKSVDGVD